MSICEVVLSAPTGTRIFGAFVLALIVVVSLKGARTELQPEPEVIGLLSLMLLQESRRAARASPAGELILLENQDRSLWNREQIAEGVALLEKALKSRRFGAYKLQAAIAAVHAEAESAAASDWRQIVRLYNQLVRIQPMPICTAGWAGPLWLGLLMRSAGADPTGTRAAILGRADSAAEIKNWSSCRFSIFATTI